ncbi:MAG: transcriptional regulator [Chloroflexota bacterium]|nr:response regulator [Ardenticatenaceae bacterium]GIK58797.1 MAG: transcriptional regulator [Chloroflexota bacterium]
MAENIRVLIVDDLSETRENVRKLLQFESDIEVIGQAGTGEEAVEMAQQLQPDIILMDINMPGIDGIGASQKITELVPSVQIIIMSVQSDPNYLRRAMMAGARDFLTKPFGGDELVAAIRRVHAKRPHIQIAPSRQQRANANVASAEIPSIPEGKVVAVFSPKGGSGCTTIAINVAVTLARRGQKTILVDGSLQFGDVAVMLDLKGATSLADLSERGEIDAELVSSVVQVHKSNLNVLLAPPRPEMADVITEENIKSLLETLRLSYDFVVLDTSSYLTEKTLTMLDVADRIILVTQQNLPNLKNARLFLDLTESLEYEAAKVWLVVNRVSEDQGISVKNIGDILKRPIIMEIPTADLPASTAANRGIPLVMGPNQKHPVSIALIKLADYTRRELVSKQVADGKTKSGAQKDSGGIFGRIFGKREQTGG